MVPITGRARSFLLVFKNKMERRGRQNKTNRPINLPNVITFSTDFKYTTHNKYIIGRAKRAPHWGVQSRFRVVCRSVCMYVCLSWSKKRRRKYVSQTRACSKSVLCGKIRPVTPVLLISTIRYSSFSMDGRETFT